MFLPPDRFLIVYVASSIIMAVLSPVAVVGNALILTVIWKKTFQRTTFHILLSGLAMSDLCTGLFAEPLVAGSVLVLLSRPKTVADRLTLFIAIKAIGDAVTTYFLFLTLFLISLMSVERWLHMSQQTLMTSRRRCLTATVILLLPSPLAVLRFLSTTNRIYEDELNISLVGLTSVCILITSVAYCNVLRIIRRHQQHVQANAPSQNFGQPAINLAKYKKSVFTILYILALFYFSFLPLEIATGVYLHVGSDSQAIWAFLYACLALLFLSSSLNPFLYLWRMNDVRNGVKMLFCSNSKRRSKANSDLSSL